MLLMKFWGDLGWGLILCSKNTFGNVVRFCEVTFAAFLEPYNLKPANILITEEQLGSLVSFESFLVSRECTGSTSGEIKT